MCVARGKCCVLTDVSSDRKKGKPDRSVCIRNHGHVKVAKRVLLFCIPFKVAVTLSSIEHAVIKQGNSPKMNVKQIAQLTWKNVTAPESRPTLFDYRFRTNRDSGLCVKYSTSQNSVDFLSFFFQELCAEMYDPGNQQFFDLTNETEMKILPSLYQLQHFTC